MSDPCKWKTCTVVLQREGHYKLLILIYLALIKCINVWQTTGVEKKAALFIICFEVCIVEIA